MTKIKLLAIIMVLITNGVFAQEENLEEDQTLNIISEVVFEGNENQNSDLRQLISETEGQKVIVSQQGNNNEAFILQQGMGTNAANYAEITQQGNSHHATLEVKGQHNAVRILQENLESELGAGIGNTYRGGITGNSNLVSVAQHGSNNSITQNVTGDSYNYQVTQKGSDNKLELDNLLPTSNPIVIEQNGEGMNLQIDNSFLPVAPGQ